MGKVKVELNLKGINEVMKSPQIMAACEAAGRAVASAAGSEYGTSSGTIKYIAYCNVFPDSKKAAKDNHDNNTILKAVSSAGLSMRKGG